MDQPTLQRDADAQAFLDAALDRILRAWAEGENLSVDELARERPDLRGDLAAVFDLAREAALLRVPVLPQVPGYDVLREIGRGGMGVVYAARQHGLDRLVALKVLPDAAAGSERARRRFLTEAWSRLDTTGASHVHQSTVRPRNDLGSRAFSRTNPGDLTFTLAPSNNQATWSIAIPNDRNLPGYSGLHTQVAVLHFISGLDAMSNGMQMTIGAR